MPYKSNSLSTDNSPTRASFFDLDIRRQYPASFFNANTIYLNISLDINTTRIIRACYDSGSQVNTISSALVSSLNLTIYNLESPRAFTLADGQPSTVVSSLCVQIPFYISGIFSIAVFHICDFRESLVLGTPWVRSFNPVLDLENQGIKSINPRPEIAKYLPLIQNTSKPTAIPTSSEKSHNFSSTPWASKITSVFSKCPIWIWILLIITHSIVFLS